MQDVVEVAAIRARDVRSDLSADIEKSMALLAGFGKDCAATRGVARLRTARIIDFFVLRDFFLLIGGALAHQPPNFLNLLIEFGVFEIAKLTDQVGGQVLLRNPACAHRFQERFRKGRP